MLYNDDDWHQANNKRPANSQGSCGKVSHTTEPIVTITQRTLFYSRAIVKNKICVNPRRIVH